MNIQSNKREKQDIYNISTYTDSEIYDILDLNSPTDRELEAKILFLINKYENFQNESGNQLAQFFNDIYKRFFDVSDSEDEDNFINYDENIENPIIEGLDNISIQYDQSSVQFSVPENLQGNITTNYGNNASINYTKPLDYSQDKLNPLLQQTTKRIISIDSQYRDNKKSLSTDFTLQLSEPLKDVVSMKLYSVQIPYTWYTISTDFGSNFFYLKGNSYGINNGDFDYMIDIPSGNYDPKDLVTTINSSITNLASKNTDVSFGKTGLIYNSNTSRITTTIDIYNQFNETSYYLQFPDVSAVSPYSNDDKRVGANNTSIAEYLGFVNKIYKPFILNGASTIGLIKNTISQDINVRSFTLTALNNYFTVYKYIGTSENFDTSGNNIDFSFNVTFSLPVGSSYTRSELVTDISNQIALNPYLNPMYSYIQRFDVSSTTFDPSTNGFGNNSFFQLSLKTNRKTTKNNTNSKLRVVFEDPSSQIWYGGASCFQFPRESSGQLNNIISDTSPVSNSKTKFDISTNVYIHLDCIKRGFDLPINSYDISLNKFNNYNLQQYITSINTSIQSASVYYNNEINPNNSSAFIDSSGFFNLLLDINKRIDQTNFKIDASGYCDICGNFSNTKRSNNPYSVGFLTQFLSNNSNPIESSYDLSTKSFIDLSFIFLTSYTFDVSYLAVFESNPNSKVKDKKYLIPPPNFAPTLTQLPNTINNIFSNFRDSDDNNIFNGTTFTVTSSDNNNILNGRLNIVINKFITQNDYSIRFLDDGITNTWNKNLFIDVSMTDMSYNLYSNNTINSISQSNNVSTVRSPDISNNIIVYQSPIVSAIGIRGYKNISQNTITLNSYNNFFNIIPFENGVLSSHNQITITIPFQDGNNNLIAYTRDNLLIAINNAFSNNKTNPEISNSLITIKPNNSGIEYTNIRLTINKEYSAKDYILDFYDPVSFVKCFIGAPSVQNTTWDSTIGWILGYRESTYYVLSQYSSSLSPIQITGDTTISTNLFNYFLICLDDYNQNHLNDGLVTVTSRDTSIPLPSYANKTNFICDPVTRNLSYNTTMVTDYNRLTQNQIYSLTEIANSTNKTNLNVLNNSVSVNSYSKGPYVQDVFAIIPLRLSGLNNGSYFVDNGGSLQNQQRLYFGPVNLFKFSIKLVDDRGNIVNLNNSNWSFSILCELLYKPNPSK
jgi:hypothetical protein